MSKKQTEVTQEFPTTLQQVADQFGLKIAAVVKFARQGTGLPPKRGQEIIEAVGGPDKWNAMRTTFTNG